MGVHRFEDLEAWQLANQLKREVYALVEQSRTLHDFKFRDQVRDAAASASRNIAEGFGRYRPAPFAQFLEIAIGSLMETQALLRDGVDRSLQVSTKLLLYLKSRPRAPGRRT